MFDWIDSCLISSGLVRRYKAINANKVKYLAVVIDSEEARQTKQVIKLLKWLKAIGVRNVCLYDADGVLKNSKAVIMNCLADAKLFEDTPESDVFLHQGQLILEFASASDGKAAVARAANVLLTRYRLGEDQEKSVVTESGLTETLKELVLSANWIFLNKKRHKTKEREMERRAIWVH